jgi:hypothetical protein
MSGAMVDAETLERERSALASGWEGARQVLDFMLILLDPPAAIAGRRTIGSRTRQLMCDWIRNLEILVRRLLVIAALALVLPPSHRAGGKRSVREPRPFVLDNPASWKVCLRLFQTPSGNRGARSRRTRHHDRAEWNALTPSTFCRPQARTHPRDECRKQCAAYICGQVLAHPQFNHHAGAGFHRRADGRN